MRVKKQISIIDYEKKYATSSGLPISMKIQATSTIKLNMGYTFDLESFIKNPENSNFAYKFIPRYPNIWIIIITFITSILRII